mmetsp:Transcript_19311/g.53711  ORF Transcript_19311/g.53711 Transcript_19311/m.53711 type:complete len:304 (-) Transcript_19311:92-1003(-)
MCATGRSSGRSWRHRRPSQPASTSLVSRPLATAPACPFSTTTTTSTAPSSSSSSWMSSAAAASSSPRRQPSTANQRPCQSRSNSQQARTSPTPTDAPSTSSRRSSRTFTTRKRSRASPPTGPSSSCGTSTPSAPTNPASSGRTPTASLTTSCPTSRRSPAAGANSSPSSATITPLPTARASEITFTSWISSKVTSKPSSMPRNRPADSTPTTSARGTASASLDCSSPWRRPAGMSSSTSWASAVLGILPSAILMPVWPRTKWGGRPSGPLIKCAKMSGVGNPTIRTDTAVPANLRSNIVQYVL